MSRRELMSILLAVVVLICAVVLLYSPIRLRLLVASVWDRDARSNAHWRRPQIPNEFEW